MKKHVMISLEENDIIKLRAISNLRGMNVSQYITLLAKTAVVYHKLNEEETT